MVFRTGRPLGRNYLRVRGEYLLIVCFFASLAELPPRARRIPVPGGRRGTPMGTTSACAENTPPAHHGNRPRRNYLRVRGEYQAIGEEGLRDRELPPRARRILTVFYGGSSYDGTTSACAENTPAI